jgi:multicomponent Na+:H+ antiporter subunit A
MPLVLRFAFVLLPLTGLGLLAWLLLLAGLPQKVLIDWVPQAGVSLAWHLDGLAALMLLLITGVGTAVFVYAGGYLSGHPQQQRLYVLLVLFMLAMVGCVTADNLILLFVFWELTSLTSFLLVGFNHTDLSSRKSAQQAFIVTGTGGLVLLAGLILLGQEAGTYTISDIVVRVPSMQPSVALDWAMLLIVIGCFTKSAQFPFHFWLPNAMSAPTPVSAYLHSATMVKLGVYLLARLDPAFGANGVWITLLTLTGSITGAWAMLLALRERDLKRILAWSTVATLGTLVMLIGMQGEAAAAAVATLLLAHALYKAPLFFVAGNVDHGTGTRIIDRLGGLRTAMPFTAAAALIAGASMAGLPLSFGYVAKDVITLAKASTDVIEFAKLANFVFTVIAVAVAAVAALRVFWRHPGENQTLDDAHEGGLALILPPLILGSIGLLLGLFPHIADPLIAAATAAMVPGSLHGAVGLEFELGTTLVPVAIAVVLGGLVFLLWDPLHRLLELPGQALQRVAAQAWYERFLAGIPTLAAWMTRRLQQGELSGYMASLTLICAIAILAAFVLSDGRPSLPVEQVPAGLGLVVSALMIVAGALLACFIPNRLTLVLASGLVGYGSAVLFLFTGAPDLAFTQLSVETVFVIVFAAVILTLSRQGRQQGLAEPVWRPGAAFVSVLLGSVLTLLLLWAYAQPFDRSLPDWFGANSLVQAQGRNVTNVIIVDFRGLDTFGEIAVVLFSLVAALPLLRGLKMNRSSREGA